MKYLILNLNIIVIIVTLIFINILKNYIECYDYNQDEEESNVELSKEAIEQLARGIDPIDIKKYCEEHSEVYLEFLKETEGKTLDEVIGFYPFELTEEE